MKQYSELGYVYVSYWVGFDLTITHGPWIIHTGYLISGFKIEFKTDREVIYNEWLGDYGSLILILGLSLFVFNYSFNSLNTDRNWDN